MGPLGSHSASGGLFSRLDYDISVSNLYKLLWSQVITRGRMGKDFL